MRLKNANKLARSKIRRYKRRTLLTLIPISLFFWCNHVTAFDSLESQGNRFSRR